MTIQVMIRSMGKAGNKILSQAFELENQPNTAGELLEEAVKTCIREYESKHGLLICLTGQILEDMVIDGRITFENHYSTGMDTEEAIANARQCFEDGMIRVILDDKQLIALDQEIVMTEESVVVFVRLAMLSGRY